MVGGQDGIGNPRTADEPPTGAQEAIHKLDLNVGGEQLRVSLRPVFQLIGPFDWLISSSSANAI